MTTLTIRAVPVATLGLGAVVFYGNDIYRVAELLHTAVPSALDSVVLVANLSDNAGGWRMERLALPYAHSDATAELVVGGL